MSHKNNNKKSNFVKYYYCYSSPLTLMESALAEGKVAIILFLMQLRDGDIWGGCVGGVVGNTGSRVFCITREARGLYVG